MIRWFFPALFAGLVSLLSHPPLAASLFAAQAQELSALARPGAEGVTLRDRAAGVDLSVALTRAVPWRLRTLADPPRLVLDFRSVAFGPLPPDLAAASAHVRAVSAAEVAGWSRLTVALDGPYRVDAAGMTTEPGGARVRVALRRTDAETFAAHVAETAADQALAAGAPAVVLPARRTAGATGATGAEGALHVMLDPGHGGVDPGAVRDGVHEADVTLAFARVLRDALRRRGVTVSMTREADVFVSLDGRVARARRAGADVFVSLHADAVPEGVARGAQVWTLSREASSRAGADLAERHNRADLLAGLDLTGQDDQIARVLMDLARTETAPRTEALADALVAGIRGREIRLHARPRESAAFAVLKAPDIPSALVELGFMSSRGDLEKLLDPDWRARMAEALADGLMAWAEADAVAAELRRK